VKDVSAGEAGDQIIEFVVLQADATLSVVWIHEILRGNSYSWKLLDGPCRRGGNALGLLWLLLKLWRLWLLLLLLRLFVRMPPPQQISHGLKHFPVANAI